MDNMDQKVQINVVDPETGNTYVVSVSRSTREKILSDPEYKEALLETLKNMREKSGTLKHNLSTSMKATKNLHTEEESCTVEEKVDKSDDLTDNEIYQNAAKVLQSRRKATNEFSDGTDYIDEISAVDTNDSTNVNLGKRKLNSIENVSIEREAIRWTKPMILLLLHLYSERKDFFNDPQCSVSKNWYIIAENFKRNGYNITAEQCRSKMEYLKRQYKEIKDHNSKSGNNRKDFEYMTEMDNLFAHEVYMSPVSTASSVYSGSESDDDENYRIKIPRRNNKSKQDDVLKELLAERVRSRKQKEAHMKVKTDLTKSLISLISKVVEEK